MHLLALCFRTVRLSGQILLPWYRLEQSWWNLQRMFTSPYWWPS